MGTVPTKGANISGLAVRRYRDILGISQKDFAARCEVKGLVFDRDTVAKIERGGRYVKDSELVTMAEVLECSPHDLLGWKDFE